MIKYFPDETNLIQARCILKKDKCGSGYFIDAVGKCGQCDEACDQCHGPGALSCDTCAKGYGSRSTDYCRPCCSTGENPDVARCGEWRLPLPDTVLLQKTAPRMPSTPRDTRPPAVSSRSSGSSSYLLSSWCWWPSASVSGRTRNSSSQSLLPRLATVVSLGTLPCTTARRTR